MTIDCQSSYDTQVFIVKIYIRVTRLSLSASWDEPPRDTAKDEQV